MLEDASIVSRHASLSRGASVATHCRRSKRRRDGRRYGSASKLSTELRSSAARGVLVGPGLADWDFSLNKDTALPKLGEKGLVEFRAEFFNIVNHTNFNFPGISQNNQNFIQTGIGTGIVNPAAGVVSTTATNARQIQFGLRLEF